MPANILSLLQTSDSFFPSGSYAHSHGLETCVELGLVRNESDLESFLGDLLRTVFQRQEIPACLLAQEFFLQNKRRGLLELDTKLHALKVAQELRKASIQTGIARWNILLSLLPREPLLIWFDACRKDGQAHGHHSLVCGLQNACLGIPPQIGAQALAYQALSGAVSAGMRLLRFGQETAQRMIFRLAAGIPAAVAEAGKISLEDLGASAPILDIAAMRHHRAYRRLFLS